MAAGGVHTNNEVDGPVGKLGDVGNRRHAEYLLAVQVGAEDGTGVPGCQQVVQGHESELPRMAGRSGDDHAPRLEERLELLVRRPSPASGRGRNGGGWAQLDEGVDGDRPAVGADDQRIDVDARHVVALVDHPADGDEGGNQLVAVDGGLAAERAEQRARAQFVDHPGRHRGVDGCWAEHDVGDRFGKHAADAEHHGRSELRITNGPGDQLAPPLDHRSDQQLDVTVVGLHRAEQRVGGLADRIGVDDAETNAGRARSCGRSGRRSA